MKILNTIIIKKNNNSSFNPKPILLALLFLYFNLLYEIKYHFLILLYIIYMTIRKIK